MSFCGPYLAFWGHCSVSERERERERDRERERKREREREREREFRVYHFQRVASFHRLSFLLSTKLCCGSKKSVFLLLLVCHFLYVFLCNGFMKETCAVSSYCYYSMHLCLLSISVRIISPPVVSSA